MKRIVTCVALLSSLAFAAALPADTPDVSGVDPVQMALDKLVRAATGPDWSSELAAREELASLADDAVPKVTEAARSNGEVRVRRACYELLTSAFAKDDRAIDTVIRFGLTYERLRAEAASLAAAGKTPRHEFGSRRRYC
jgi:hypothetical protein